MEKSGVAHSTDILDWVFWGDSGIGLLGFSEKNKKARRMENIFKIHNKTLEIHENHLKTKKYPTECKDRDPRTTMGTCPFWGGNLLLRQSPLF